MKTGAIQSISFFISLIIYNYFFWNEGLGINLFLFSLLLITYLFFQYRESFRSKNVLITLGGTIVTAVMVVVYNSSEGKFAHIFSFALMVAFIHESGLRSVVYAFMHSLSGVIKVPYNFVAGKYSRLSKIPRVGFALRILRLSLLPLSIALVFFTLYSVANPIFGNYAGRFINSFIRAFNNFFLSISLERILFIISGAILLSAVYFRSEIRIFLEKDLSFSEKLQRIRLSRNKKTNTFSGLLYPNYHSVPAFKTIALKNQNRTAIILLLMVNALLLAENFIDIKWLWFGFSLPEEFSLKHYVREGTGFLIISILLSMGLLLHYFRRNQNFYPKNQLLKWLSYLWIAQNIIPSFSVYMRNSHYIDFHGLAYKRIGVDVFVILTITGLITLYYKIRKIKSAYFLIRINTWALYIMIIALSCFNWDVKIAEYNLAHWNKGEIDVDFYLQLSNKALPVIYANLDKVKSQIDTHKNNKVRWITYLDYDVFMIALENKKSKFLEKYKEHTWLSFNLPERNAYNVLSAKEMAALD